MPPTEVHDNSADALSEEKEQFEQQRYQSDVNDIAEYIGKHQCILFLGSGIHAPAPAGSKYIYPRAKCPPFGKGLSKILAKSCRYPKKEDRKNLQRVASYYEKQAAFPGRLHKAVSHLVQHGREPSPILRGLARLEFPIVITTNYDHLFEEALGQVARQRAEEQGASPDAAVAATMASLKKWIYTPKRLVQTLDCDPQPDHRKPYLLKIHGDIDRKDSMVITDEDYIDFILRMNDPLGYRPVGDNVRKHLMHEEWATLFIGYSLGDYNLRILFKTLRWNLDPREIPENYAVDIRPDVLIRYWWEERRQYVRFITRDLWQFVPDVYRKVMGEEMPQ